MRPTSRGRRAVLLLALALASGGLAASEVRTSLREVEERVGTPLQVVTTQVDLPAGEKLDADRVQDALDVRDVPELFAPTDALGTPEEAIGLRTAVPLVAGSYVTSGHLETTRVRQETGPLLAPGERVVELAVAGGDAVTSASPETRVDVLITTEGRSGPGRTYVALESVELLDVRPAAEGLEAGGGESASGAGAVASLRVTLQQAVLLTAAQNFARELRLLARSPDDERRVGSASVDGGEL